MNTSETTETTATSDPPTETTTTTKTPKQRKAGKNYTIIPYLSVFLNTTQKHFLKKHF